MSDGDRQQAARKIVALSSAQLRVKPLVWRGFTYGPALLPAWKSDGGIIIHSVKCGEYIFRIDAYPTLDAAKAAAQADYEASILAGLE